MSITFSYLICAFDHMVSEDLHFAMLKAKLEMYFGFVANVIHLNAFD